MRSIVVLGSIRFSAWLASRTSIASLDMASSGPMDFWSSQRYCLSDQSLAWCAPQFARNSPSFNAHPLHLSPKFYHGVRGTKYNMVPNIAGWPQIFGLMAMKMDHKLKLKLVEKEHAGQAMYARKVIRCPSLPPTGVHVIFH